MELFVIALLTAVAAASADEAQKVAPPPDLRRLPPPRLPDPDIDPFGYQKHAVQFWTFMGEPIVLWNEVQESGWMLGHLMCPEGHVADGDNIQIEADLEYQSYDVVPGQTIRMDDAQSSILEKVVPDGQGGWDNFEAMPPTGYCSDPRHRGPRRFTIPQPIAEALWEGA